MPWKGEKDPYRIWLSEIILQQTRVEQGLAYYENFIQAFPDVHSLANAPPERVMKLWEGLGYYSRCRNLMQTAKQVSQEYGGNFPSDYNDILRLKGVGPYTAAAIASFSFSLPHAVVDGNVFRVLSRVFGEFTPIDTTEGKKLFSMLAEELLDKNKPGEYNQAIMDFGATICKPAPVCKQCPFLKVCHAFKKGCIDSLPVKSKKLAIRKRWFYYFILEHEGKIALRRRNGKDIWQELYEYPMLEYQKHLTNREIISLASKEGFTGPAYKNQIKYSPVYKQQLSHQLISGKFIRLSIAEKPSFNDWIWLEEAQMREYPFPRLIHTYLDSNVKSLS